jgi:hypothetical protein
MTNPIDPVREYINAQRSVYSDQAIRGALIAAGHDPELVDVALREHLRRGEVESHAWSRSLRTGQFWLLFASSLVLFLLVLWLSALNMFNLGSAFLAVGIVALFVVALYVLVSPRFGTDVRRGVGCAILAIVLTPVITVAGILAYCLVARPNLYY